jgi:hypothetical protein
MKKEGSESTPKYHGSVTLSLMLQKKLYQLTTYRYRGLNGTVYNISCASLKV